MGETWQTETFLLLSKWLLLRFPASDNYVYSRPLDSVPEFGLALNDYVSKITSPTHLLDLWELLLRQPQFVFKFGYF